jgi:hypothetical protein
MDAAFLDAANVECFGIDELHDEDIALSLFSAARLRGLSP